jgi:hypothetical protein
MIVFALVFFLHLKEIQAACLPESLPSENKILTHEMKVIEETAQKFETMMLRELPPTSELVVRLDPLNPRVNAEVIKNNASVTISVWGGMLSHPKMNAHVLLLLLCHELGHDLGGPPLKSRNGWSSTEGQADYFSTLSCLKNFEFDEDQFLASAEELSGIYAEVNMQGRPSVDTCDESTVLRINFGYPSAQCRLDTLLAGWRAGPRPRCWYID